MNRLVFYSRRYLIIAAWVVVSTLGLSVFSHDQANAASYPKYTYNTDGSFIISGGSLSKILNSGSSIEVKLDAGVWTASFQVKSDSSCDSNQADIRLTANGVTEPVDSIVTDVLVECLEGDLLEIGGVHYGDSMEYWTDGNQKVIKPTATTPPGQPGPVKPPGIDGDEQFRFLHEKDPTGQYIIACVGMFHQFSGIGAPGTDLEGCFEFSEGTAPGEDPTLTWERVLNVNNPTLYGCGGAGVKSYKFTITVDTPTSMNHVGAVPGTLTVKPDTHANCTDLDLKSAADGMPIEIMGGQDLESLLGMPVEGTGESQNSLCEVTGGLSWILCPIMNTVADINEEAYNLIEHFLKIPPMMTDGSGSGAYEIWKMIRNLANALFAVVFIIIIYSQLTSAGISNYGIKKMLPKLLVGIILVNTSYWMVALAVDLSNVVGSTIYNVMDNMAKEAGPSEGAPGWKSITAGTLTGALVGGVAFVMAGMSVLLPMLVSAVFMIIGLVFVLTFRHALVFILAVVAPLAIVAYLLPNTEGLFKSWSKMLRVLLYIYPAIGFIMGASNVAAMIVFAAAQSAEGMAKFVMMLIAVGMPAMAIFAALMLAKTMGSVAGKLGFTNPFGGMINAAKERAGAFGRNKDGELSQNRFASKIGGIGQSRRTARDFKQQMADEKYGNYAKARVLGTKRGQAAFNTQGASQQALNKAKTIAEIDELRTNKNLHVDAVVENMRLEAAQSEQAARVSSIAATGAGEAGAAAKQALLDKHVAGLADSSNKRLSEQGNAQSIINDAALAREAGGADLKYGQERAMAYSYEAEDKIVDQNIAAEKSMLSNKNVDNPELVKIAGNMNESVEKRAAAASLIMSGGHRESQLELLKTVGTAKRAGDPNVGAVQKQLLADMKQKPFALSDTAIGKLRTGDYDDDIYADLMDRVENKLSAEAVVSMDPDELKYAHNQITTGGATPEQVANFKAMILEARGNSQLSGGLKPQASRLHDDILKY